MKKLIKYALILFAAAGVLASCKKEVEDIYTPASPDAADCLGVYFPTQEASGSHTYDPSMERSISVTVSRGNTKDAVSVPYTLTVTTATGDGASAFVAPKTIDFADGQTETSFDITFENAVEGVNYAVTLLIDDPQYASIYTSSPSSLNFDILIVSWQDFLNPKTGEPAIITLTEQWWGETHTATLKYYEVGGIRTAVLTSNETDEEGNPTGIWGDTQNVGLTFRWYVEDQDGFSHKNNLGFDFLEVPKQYFGFDYAGWGSKPEEEATSPIYVYDYPWYWVERGYPFDGSSQGTCWLDEANLTGNTTGNYPVGYYDGNGGFFFNLRYYIPGVGGFSPPEYDFVGIAEGFVRTDYSLEVGTDYSYDGVTPVYLEAGKDVDHVNYAVYPGELTSTQALNKEPLITDGTDESVEFAEFELDEDTNKKYATLELVPETSGIYTVVVVAYDETGASQEANYVVINHVSAEDVEAKSVVLSVFTEPTPARYESAGYDEYNSFAFGILGENITEAHVAIVKSSSLTNSFVSTLKADANGRYAVNDATLDAINGVGGYYDAVSGLDAGTEYAVVVWATNGDMEDLAYDFFTTTETPEEWESYGTATWTDIFFGPWFEADALSYDVALERSVDDPTRFRLVNVYGEAFPYNEPGDWDDTKNYYFVLNTADPDYVYAERFDTGCNWGYGNFLIISQVSRYISNYSLDVIKQNNIPAGVYDAEKNTVTFAPGALLKAMAELDNGSLYYGNKDDEFVITFHPGAELSSAPAKKVTGRTAVKSATSFTARNLGPTMKFEREAKPVSVKATVSYNRMPAKVVDRTAQPVAARKF